MVPHAFLNVLAASIYAAASETPTPKESKGKKKETATAEPGDKNTPDPSESPAGGGSDQSDPFGTILDFVLAYPWIPGIIIAIIAANIGWRKLVEKQNLSGQPLSPLGSIIRRTLRLIFKEDKTPVFMRPQKFAMRMRWLTWQRYWFICLGAVAFDISAFSGIIPDQYEIVFTALIILFILGGIKHIRLVFQRRHRILMQMFEVAAAECKYPKGSELNPWGWVQITKWNGLYSPAGTYVVFPPRVRSEDERFQQAFETNFASTVSSEHTWMYSWESANNRVLCEPVPFITDNAPYPFPDEHPWNEFPLGIGAGGKEAVVDVATFPHFLVAGTTGSGKLIQRSTKIPTPSGWTTMGDLKVGDTLFDDQGKPCRVTWVSEVNPTPDLYEIEFSDGSVIQADAEHLWFTETRQVRESRWNTQRKPTARRRLVSKEREEKLRALAAEVDDTHEITLPQVARLAGVSETTSWLREVADRVGHVGETSAVIEFHYAEQTVTQKQKVRVYPAQAAWSGLLKYAGDMRKPSPRWEPILREATVLQDLAMSAQPQDTVTSVQVAEVLGMGKAAHAAEVLKTAKVPNSVEIRQVQLKVPARTVRRRGPAIAKSYRTKTLIAAICERIERPAHDQRDKKVSGSVKTTREILATLTTSSGYRNHAIPVAGPLELPVSSLPIDPYLLGVWLGDGSSTSGDYVGIDKEIAEHIRERGYEVVERREPPRQDGTARHADYRIWRVVGLRGLLGQEGLLQTTTSSGSQKKIPATYLRASIAQRRDLLAGLLDTDGTVSPSGAINFDNTNTRLAHQVRELALSLGYRATITSSIKRSQTGKEALSWRVSWTCQDSPFALSRKSRTHKERNKNFSPERNATRFIVDVRPIPTSPGLCIQVDSPSRLFLAGEAMIPTHNSVTQRTILLHALQSPDWRVSLIDPKRVELSAYTNHRNVVKVATELDESVALLEGVEQEMQSRYKRMEKEGVNHFKRLKSPPPAMMLMVDELFALLSPENIRSDEGKERDEMHARATVIIGSIARLGRAAGVHMVLATQRPDAKVLPGETKALAIDTPILTIEGWKTIEQVRQGDYVFAPDGAPTQVTGVTEVMHDHECYELVFSDGSRLTADAGHLWVVGEDGAPPRTTESLFEELQDFPAAHLSLPLARLSDSFSGLVGPLSFASPRYITHVFKVPSVPVKCIAVAHPSRLFLAGRTLIPTHNSNLDCRIAQGRMDTTPSLMVLDSEAATRIPKIKGRAMVRMGGDITEFQAYFLPEDSLGMVLEMSEALAGEQMSVQDFKDLIEQARAGEGGSGGGKFRLPKIPVPSGLASRVSQWVERRKRAVEENEAEGMRFASQKTKPASPMTDPSSPSSSSPPSSSGGSDPGRGGRRARRGAAGVPPDAIRRVEEPVEAVEGPSGPSARLGEPWEEEALPEREFLREVDHEGDLIGEVRYEGGMGGTAYVVDHDDDDDDDDDAFIFLEDDDEDIEDLDASSFLDEEPLPEARSSVSPASPAPLPAPPAPRRDYVSEGEAADSFETAGPARNDYLPPVDVDEEGFLDDVVGVDPPRTDVERREVRGESLAPPAAVVAPSPQQDFAGLDEEDDDEEEEGEEYEEDFFTGSADLFDAVPEAPWMPESVSSTSVGPSPFGGGDYAAPSASAPPVAPSQDDEDEEDDRPFI